MIEAYFTLSGRLRRLPYFGYGLLLIPVVLVLGGLVFFSTKEAQHPVAVLLILASLLVLLLAWAGLALGVKRCHDFNRSGWLYFWIAWLPGILSCSLSITIGGAEYELALPVIGNIAGVIALIGGLYVLFKRGTDGANRFGVPD